MPITHGQVTRKSLLRSRRRRREKGCGEKGCGRRVCGVGGGEVEGYRDTEWREFDNEESEWIGGKYMDGAKKRREWESTFECSRGMRQLYLRFCVRVKRGATLFHDGKCQTCWRFMEIDLKCNLLWKKRRQSNGQNVENYNKIMKQNNRIKKW